MISEQNRAYGRALRALAHLVDTKYPDAPNGDATQLAEIARRWMLEAFAEVGGPPAPVDHIPGYELLPVTVEPSFAPWNQPKAQP